MTLAISKIIFTYGFCDYISNMKKTSESVSHSNDHETGTDTNVDNNGIGTDITSRGTDGTGTSTN